MPVASVYLISLLGYIGLSYFYFVELNAYKALAVWLGLLALKYFVKPLREHFSLLLLIGICFSFLRLLHLISPYFQWPLDFYLTSIFGFLLYRYFFRKQTQRLKWSFAFSKKEILSIFVITIPSVAVLYWYFTNHPEVSEMFPNPDIPFWSLPFAILGVAAINGLREEIFYRGLIQPQTSRQSPIWYVVGLQAVLFGFLHFSNAFPQGWLGVGMTALWGAAIAIQYQIFKSISLAWMTHALADATMFAIILYSR